MNIENPVTKIMSKYVKTLHPLDNLWDVKLIFDRFNIHHIPITQFRHVKGMISKSDYNHFVSGAVITKEEIPAEKERLSAIIIADVMKKKIITIRKKDPIRLAMEIFRANHLHALPVMDGKILTGIVTPFDVMNELLNENLYPSESQTAKNLSAGFK